MRKFILPILIGLLVVSVVFNVHHFMSRRSNAQTEAGATKEIWTCPMDPQIKQDHPGKCPICGMNLVLQTAAMNTPTKTESAPAPSKDKSTVKYQCPMHPTIIRDQPGDCPICGMKLVKMRNTTDEKTTAAPAARKIAFYRSPMNPKQTSPVPRKDEMGMDYVPVYENETAGGESNVADRTTVTIDPDRQQLIGLRTASVVRDSIGAEWSTVGRVQADPTRVSKIAVKVSGYVERAYVDFVGQSVERGEQLFTFYSPDLFALQQEYLLAFQAQKAATNRDAMESDSIMLAAARQKLKLWDVPDSQIERLERTGNIAKALTFVSPVSGVVTAKNIVEGSYLNPGDVAYEVTDLGSVWVIADAYQSDAARVSVGMAATITLDALPNRHYSGQVSFVDPVLDPQSRTFKVRMNVENEKGELKPDMFAEVRFQSAAHFALTVPTDAIIPTGRSNMVFVALGDGKFQPRAVKLGAKASGRVEITDGVSEGELVVTRANFLIDSESSLRAALAAVGGAQ